MEYDQNNKITKILLTKLLAQGIDKKTQLQNT
jgi:hypothetical protein